MAQKPSYDCALNFREPAGLASLELLEDLEFAVTSGFGVL